MLVNKGTLNDVEQKKLNEFTIHHDRDGSDNDRRMSSTYTRRDRDGSDNDRHMSSTYARRDNRRDTRRGNRDDRLSPVRESHRLITHVTMLPVELGSIWTMKTIRLPNALALL